jgi:hypothetical protein
MTRWLLYPSKFEPINAPANPIASTQWFGALSEPRKVVIAAAILAASGCTLAPQPIAAPAMTPIWGWHIALSQPVAAKRQFRSDVVLPPSPPATVPTGWQSALSEPARGQRRAFQPLGISIPPQPPQVAVAVPQGWFRALSEPYFPPQSVVARFARVVSPVFSFKPPAAPIPAPPLAFFHPLSQPVFAQVKYPGTRVHFLGWNWPPPPIVIPPLWNPRAPVPAAWTDQTGASGIWTLQVPGSTTWTDQ